MIARRFRDVALVLVLGALTSACLITAPIRAAADVTGDVVRGTVDVVTPDGDKKKD